MTAITRAPTSDEAVAGGWVEAAPRFSRVADHPDLTYLNAVQCATTPGTLTFGFAPFALASNSSVQSVIVHFAMRTVGFGTASGGARLKVGGTYFNEAPRTFSISAATIDSAIWATNPKTGGPWSVDEINGIGPNALEAFGIFADDVDPTIQVSSVQLRVDYNAGFIAQVRSPTSDEAFAGIFDTPPYFSLLADYPELSGRSSLSSNGPVELSLTCGFPLFAVPANASVLSVTVRYTDRKQLASEGTAVSGRLRVGETYYNHPTAHDATATADFVYTERADSWVTNPRTGNPWTVTEVNGAGPEPLEAFGVRAAPANTYVFFSSVRLEVSYAVGATVAATGLPSTTALGTALVNLRAGIAPAGIASTTAVGALTAARRGGSFQHGPPLISSSHVHGNGGLGVLGAVVPSAGQDGPSFLYNDLTLPGDAGKEIRGLVESGPSGATAFFAYEDGSFTLEGPPATYSFTYRLFVDGVDTSTAVATAIVVGPVEATGLPSVTAFGVPTVTYPLPGVITATGIPSTARFGPATVAAVIPASGASHQHSGALVSGAHHFGNSGLGVLGNTIPSGGDDGPSFLFNDLELPADLNREIRGFVESGPVGATSFFANEDGSFTLEVPIGGAYSFVYRLYADGIDRGTGTVTINVGQFSSILANGFINPTALGTPSVVRQNVRLVVPNSIASTTALGAPVVGGGARLVVPPGIPSAESFGLHAVGRIGPTGFTANVLAAGIDSTTAFGEALAIADTGHYVFAPGIPSATAFGPPNVMRTPYGGMESITLRCPIKQSVNLRCPIV